MFFNLNNGYSLRSFIKSDEIALSFHGNNKEVIRYLRNSFPSPYTIEAAREWIAYIQKYESDYRFAIDYNSEVIGEIGFTMQTDVHRYTAEIGFWISEIHWGKGVGSMVLSAMIKYGFEKKKIARIYADVFEGNTASCQLLEKCNFELEAVLKKNIYKNGFWYDNLVYALLNPNYLKCNLS